MPIKILNLRFTEVGLLCDLLLLSVQQTDLLCGVKVKVKPTSLRYHTKNRFYNAYLTLSTNDLKVWGSFKTKSLKIFRSKFIFLSFIFFINVE